MKRIVYVVVFACLAFSYQASAQDRFVEIENGLNNLVATSPGLNEKVELSVNEVSMQEFVRAMAMAHNLNISVDPSLRSISIVNNFANVSVKEVMLFLCKQYNMDVEFIGSIMSLSKYEAPLEVKPAVAAKKLKIEYNKANDFLSVDLRKDSLAAVVKEITRRSGHNVIVAPGLENQLINVFIQNRPFDNTLDKLALANGLEVSKTDDNFYYIEKPEAAQKTSSRPGKGGKSRSPRKGAGSMTMSVVDERITMSATDVPIVDLVAEVSGELYKQFFLFSEPEGNTTLYVEGLTYEDFLSFLLNGTEFTFRNQEDVYLIGERKLEGLRVTELVQMEYRTVESVLDFIPSELKKNVDIQEFTDLNGLILSGSSPRIREIKDFLHEVDRVVPMVQIEVLIIDVRNTVTLSTGIRAGLADEPVSTGGTVFPGLDITLSSQAINNVISGINGFGLVNLGKVTQNFYISLQALETQGFIKIRSTPQLATLNGHEASMTIGETRYYLETQITQLGTVTASTTTAQNYKSVNADLSITINPLVSSDEHVTLEINVKQSSFGERISEQAPYGTITRDFQSLIRVKNNEMIILGGLEDNATDDTGSGVPFLSRIPVIKWFFSSRSKKNSRSKLTIFVKPTIIY